MYMYFTPRIAGHPKTCRSCSFSSYALLSNFFSPISTCVNCVSFAASGYSLVYLPTCWLLMIKLSLQSVKDSRALFHTCFKPWVLSSFSFLSSWFIFVSSLSNKLLQRCPLLGSRRSAGGIFMSGCTPQVGAAARCGCPPPAHRTLAQAFSLISRQESCPVAHIMHSPG